MKLEILEVKRQKNFPEGYGCRDLQREDSPETLEAIINWSKDKDVQVYRHYIRHVYENICGIYDFEKNGWSESPHRPKNIHECDYVTYVDVYYQKKNKD